MNTHTLIQKYIQATRQWAGSITAVVRREECASLMVEDTKGGFSKKGLYLYGASLFIRRLEFMWRL